MDRPCLYLNRFSMSDVNSLKLGSSMTLSISGTKESGAVTRAAFERYRDFRPSCRIVHRVKGAFMIGEGARTGLRSYFGDSPDHNVMTVALHHLDDLTGKRQWRIFEQEDASRRFDPRGASEPVCTIDAAKPRKAARHVFMRRPEGGPAKGAAGAQNGPCR